MTEVPVSLESLLYTRELLIQTVNQSLSDSERDFLISVKKGEPDYALMPFKDLDIFPALRWKLINIRKMHKDKHTAMLHKLVSVLNV